MFSLWLYWNPVLEIIKKFRYFYCWSPHWELLDWTSSYYTLVPGLIKTPKGSCQVILLSDKERHYLFGRFLAKDVTHETWLCEWTGMMEPKWSNITKRSYKPPPGSDSDPQSRAHWVGGGVQQLFINAPIYLSLTNNKELAFAEDIYKNT